MDVFPIPSVRCDYGFDNMQLFHGDVMTPEGLSAETILLGLYQVIWKDIGNDEYDGGALYPVLNSIGASKRMILEAYESNALDEFLHKYINSVLARVGDRGTPHYCIAWLQNKLVIGPTRLLLSDEVVLTGAQIPGGVLPYKRLMGMCRWMGSHFHDWIDYNGVTFLVELLEWGRTFSGFLG